MCGIAAVIGEGVDIDQVVDCLQHRGPDHRGVERFGRVSLGMVRLAILDPRPRSNQPFSIGSHTIVYNGEIYNYREVCARLTAKGIAFTTESDTEVLLGSLIAEGPEALGGFEGMFAFVLLDHETGRVLAGRDSEGIKPLYYRATPAGHVFASEARAAAIGATTVAIEGIREFLAFGSTWSHPIFESVEEFPPGHFAELGTDGELRFTEFDPEPCEATADVVDSFDGLIERHIRSDRPVALALSGGFDSALLASRIAPMAPGTTAVTLDTGHMAHDVDGARRTAAHYGLPIEVHRVDPASILDAFIRYIWAMDQPTVDGFNTFLLSEFTRSQGIPVLISGLGADEALNGYSYARYGRRQRLLRMVYRLLPGAGREFLTDRIAHRFQRTPENVHRLLTPRTPPVEQFFAWREIFGPDEITAMTGGRASLPAMPPGLTDTEAFQQLDRLVYLRCTLLRDTDIFSMASGVEMRVPFVTDAFRSIAATLPTRSKSGLAEMFADPYLLERATAPKTGFSLPLDTWSEFVAGDRASAPVPPASRSFDHDLINDALGRLEIGPYAGLRKWSIAVLRAWLDKHSSESLPR